MYSTQPKPAKKNTPLINRFQLRRYALNKKKLKKFYN